MQYQQAFGSSMKYDIEITFKVNPKIRQLNFLSTSSFCILLEKRISAAFNVYARLKVRFRCRSIESRELMFILGTQANFHSHY